MLIVGRPFLFYLIPIGLLILVSVMSLIVVRRFTWSIIKSERLKEDLKQRIRQEQYFRTLHRRLSEMLDRIPIPVIAINEDGEIVFANEQASKLFKSTPAQLHGVSVDLLAEPSAEEPSPKPLSKLCFGFQSGSTKYVEVRIGANSRYVESRLAELAPLSLDDEDLTVLIFHSRENNLRADNTAGLLIEELNRNKLRLEKLGQIVRLENPVDNDAIRTDLEAIDTALDQISSVLKKPELNRRNVARNVMTLSLAYWEACTGESKLELARQSGLWRIEVSPDGFERARTLDKYLDMRTFPRMPRWKNVISTGDFVLAHCSGKTGMRRELEGAMSSLRLV